MATRLSPADRKVHRTFAANCFNRTWTLLLKKHRTKAQDLEMIHAAHASRYHWGIAGKPINLAIGEWQVSRVYATLRRSEAALYHAERSLEVCRAHRIRDFPLAFAYEALARAHAVTGHPRETERFLLLARGAARTIKDADDRKILFDDLATIRPASRRRSHTRTR
jgi:hypothetical protein